MHLLPLRWPSMSAPPPFPKWSFSPLSIRSPLMSVASIRQHGAIGLKNVDAVVTADRWLPVLVGIEDADGEGRGDVVADLVERQPPMLGGLCSA
jgi:hypothetical protein